MKHGPSSWLHVGILVLLVGFAALWVFLRTGAPTGKAAKDARVRPAATAPARATPPPPDAPAGSAASGELATRLKRLQQALAAGVAPAEALRLLNEMAALLRAAPGDAAAIALIAMLEGGADAATGLAFKVGPGGNLTTAPTLRVWMLDLLGQLNPAEAARYAARIYARRDSADEWAVAMRNDWRVAAPAGELAPLRQRALELVEDTRWIKRPTSGFLEGFDLAVATMAWEAVPRLEQMLNATNELAVRRAAWVALDRLALETPADFLPALASHPEWLESQRLIRAGLFARADLGEARERGAVESYLLRPNLTAEEAGKFFELAPNVNATVSHNLATTARTPSLALAARLDRAALVAVQNWRMQPEFSRWATQLAGAEARIAEAVAAAARGNFSSP